MKGQMMTKYKLNHRDFKFFIIPFFVLFIFFGIVTYLNVKSHINEILKITETTTTNTAKTYASTLLNSKEASTIVTSLLDDKLLTASKAVLLLGDSINNYSLEELAKRFDVDQISLYNAQGAIINSSDEQYLGWQAYEGHPVYKFIKSYKATLVEEIRQDTVNKQYYKFAYVKSVDNTFVQLGVLADNIRKFISRFDLQKGVEDIIENENIDRVFLIDYNFKIVASSVSEYVGTIIEDDTIKKHLLKGEAEARKSNMYGEAVFHACAPIFYNEEWLGVLVIIWKSDLIKLEIEEIIATGVLELLLILLVIGSILFFAYKKNQSNIKIAYYDTLTGLPNAAYLDEYLKDKIKKCKDEKIAVFLLNCTNFKTVNTTHGYKYGDIILKQIADNVKSKIPANNMFFRFNADRFVLVVDYQNHEKLLKLANSLIDIFKNPFDGGKKQEYVNAQIAIIEVMNHNITVDKILQDATMALNVLNSKPDKNVIFFDYNMEVDIRRKDLIESTLRAIISGKDKNSFYLEFQPMLDANTKKIVEFEALARMNIASLGFISPLEFIEIAEKRLLIYELGNHIINEACNFINVLRSNGYESLTVAVNLSVIQLLRDEFIDDVSMLIKKSGIESSMLEFEITESILLDNFELINDKLDNIKKLGVSIALDDFGTGFSSFARLRELNVDTVKIDQYFISKISELDNKELLTADIISMSHKLGLNVVAEGVENEEQMNYLIQHKCDILQGYLISKPLRCEKALDFLSNYY